MTKKFLSSTLPLSHQPQDESKTYLDFLSGPARARMLRYAKIRAAVGDERFEAWLDRKVARRQKASDGWTSRPPFVYHRPIKHGVRVLFGSQRRGTSIAPTVQAAVTQWMQRYPDRVDGMRQIYASHGWDLDQVAREGLEGWP